VANDQSRLGGSVPRLTRKTLSLAVGEDDLQEQTKRIEKKTIVRRIRDDLIRANKGQQNLLLTIFAVITTPIHERLQAGGEAS
jgi:hypothetical protein